MKVITRKRGIKSIRKARKNGEYISEEEQNFLTNYDREQNAKKKLPKLNQENESKVEQSSEQQPSEDFILEDHVFFGTLSNRNDLSKEEVGKRIKTYFDSFNLEISNGIVSEEIHFRSGQKHFHFFLRFLQSSPVKLNCTDFNKKTGLEPRIEAPKDPVASAIYTLKDGNFILLNQQTQDDFIPTLLKNTANIKSIISLSQFCIEKKFISVDTCCELTKNNFLSTYQKEIKKSLRQFQDDLNHQNDRVHLSLILDYFKQKEKSIRSIEKYDNPIFHHDIIQKIYNANSWLLNNLDSELVIRNRSVIEEYNKQIEIFIYKTMIHTIEKFFTHKSKWKNYAILTYNVHSDLFKSSFWRLLDRFIFHFRKEQYNNPFLHTNYKEYINWKYLFMMEDETNLAYYTDSYLKQIIEGENSEIRVLNDSYPRNDGTLVALTANQNAAEMRKEEDKPAPKANFYTRVKEVNACTGIFAKMFFELRLFMKKNNIEYPESLDNRTLETFLSNPSLPYLKEIFSNIEINE